MKFLVLTFLLCSCHFHQSEFHSQDTKQIKSIQLANLKSFDYRTQLCEKIDKGVLKKISLKAHKNLILDTDRFINLRLYIHNKKDRPLLIVYPISRGRYHLAKFVAKSFYKRGWNTIIVERETQYEKIYDPQKLNLQMNELVFDNRQIVDWLYQEKLFSIKKLAMFGISKGAIKTSLIMADDPRIDAAVMALGGGDLPSILTESKEKGVLRVRNNYVKKFGVDHENFKKVLQKNFTIDPLSVANNIDGRKTLHILAYFDSSVPYKYGKQLYDAMPGASSYTLLAGHYSAILFLPFILNRAEAFYNKKLKLGN